MWSVHRQTPPYLSARHLDVVNDLGSAYYWNAPGLYLGNKVRCTHTQINLDVPFSYTQPSNQDVISPNWKIAMIYTFKTTAFFLSAESFTTVEI